MIRPHGNRFGNTACSDLSQSASLYAKQQSNISARQPVAILLALVLAILPFVVSCSPASLTQPQAPELLRPVEAPADLAQVIRGDIKPIKVAEGIVVPFSQGLGFLSSDAPISEIYVTHGQTVKKDELLAELDISVWRRRLDDAINELDHLTVVMNHENLIADIRIEYGQMDIDEATDENGRIIAELNLQEFITRDNIRRETQDLDRARVQTRIRALEDQKDNYAIYAPFDGMILSIEALTIGDYPSGRTPFLYLADLNRLTVRALSEQTSFFAVAQSIAAVIGETEWPVEIIPYTLEEQLAFYYEGISPPARFRFDVEGETFDGVQAPPTDKRVLLMAYEPGREDVIIIPINAAHIETANNEEGVTSRQDFAYVDVNGVRERRDIKCGRRSDIWIEVTEGLSEGDLVYVD